MRNKILNTALDLAEQIGYQRITRKTLARACNICPSLVSYYFSTMELLRDEILRAALRDPVRFKIVLQGLVARDPIALAASDDIRTKAKQYL